MKARVIFDTCREGSLNMALDSLLLQQLREEEQVFLRFYTCVQRLCPLVYSKSGSSNNNIVLTPWFGVLPVEKLFFICSM